ncbi:hypothetical protein TWF173_009013 [Orbilia oligospora]|nr:hypothetical protein TWF173_009013 [Orbilia oligospora]
MAAITPVIIHIMTITPIGPTAAACRFVEKNFALSPVLPATDDLHLSSICNLAADS